MMRSLPAQRPQLWQRVASAAIMLAPAAALSLGLLERKAQPRPFRPRAIFRSRGDRCGLKRGLPSWGFWAVTGSVVAPSVIGVILTWLNAPGHKELTISLRPDQVLGLLVAAGCSGSSPGFW